MKSDRFSFNRRRNQRETNGVKPWQMSPMLQREHGVRNATREGPRPSVTITIHTWRVLELQSNVYACLRRL